MRQSCGFPIKAKLIDTVVGSTSVPPTGESGLIRRKAEFSMKLLATRLVGSVLAAVAASSATMAQSNYDDQACRQYADAQVAPLRDQVNTQAFGSTLLGAGLGAAIGGAVGGGRGAGIGAASGAVVGGIGGAANAQNTAAYLQQQYYGYYSQCMASRSSARSPYAAPSPYTAPTYPPAAGYAPAGYPPPNYGPPPR
jgi:outer membrane lipoprotein SlyB